jgi:hypothetical protein
MSQEPTVSDSAAPTETTQIETTQTETTRAEPAEGEIGTADPSPLPDGGYQPPTTAPPVATGASGPTEPGPSARPGPSVPTVLWGLILALVAAGAIVHQVSDVDFNLTVGVPVALLAVGAALVLWGIAGLARKRR